MKKQQVYIKQKYKKNKNKQKQQQQQHETKPPKTTKRLK